MTTLLDLERGLNKLSIQLDDTKTKCQLNVATYEQHNQSMNALSKTLAEIIEAKNCVCRTTIPCLPAEEVPEEEKPKAPEVKIDTSKGTIDISQQIQFSANSSKLKGKTNQQLLDTIANLVLQHNLKLKIEGHTAESKQVNQDKLITLSTRRAKSVETALIERGVPAENLTAKGYGCMKPPPPGSKISHKRVDFIVSDFGKLADAREEGKTKALEES